MILDDFEERIVAESGGTGRLEANSSTASGPASGSDGTLRIGQGQLAHVMGRAALGRTPLPERRSTLPP